MTRRTSDRNPKSTPGTARTTAPATKISTAANPALSGAAANDTGTKSGSGAAVIPLASRRSRRHP